ncbi:transglycosylase SLT domain-containing protein [uncultured Litoreibacter sp.]|uniref:transglycosylase SLT domain-containing protein n=1 Tax=uncultured Litoreibacter sp. TaxID=1392394 RepID=UPI00260FEB9D|nr:transglycosylase SLT domain-containing protein [uncultured Litoreibacter sp.]
MRCHALIIAALFAASPAFAQEQSADDTAVAVAASLSVATSELRRPIPRDDHIPTARWDFRPEGRLWTRTTLEALKGHGLPLLTMVPRDMADWCPAYETNGLDKRAEFWNGFLSALAKHESTWKPRAVGGGGLWYGLTQILPGTARGYKCRVDTGEALKNGSANLSCAVRIMAVTVKRDNAVARKANGKLGGVGADWGPMTKAAKRKEMAGWLRKQSYCKPLGSIKPRQRPRQVTQLLPLEQRLSDIKPVTRPAVD